MAEVVWAEPALSDYRQIVEPPCRIFYREGSGQVVILHVMRSDRLLRTELLNDREQDVGKT